MKILLIQFYCVYTVVLLFICLIIHGICNMIGMKQGFIEIVAISTMYTIISKLLSYLTN